MKKPRPKKRQVVGRQTVAVLQEAYKPDATQLLVRRPNGSEWLLGTIEYLDVRALECGGALNLGSQFMTPVLRGRLEISGRIHAPEGIRVTFIESCAGKKRIRGARARSK